MRPTLRRLRVFMVSLRVSTRARRPVVQVEEWGFA